MPAPLSAPFFLYQLQIFDEGSQKAKVDSKIHLFSDSFFVFVFGICNLISHLGPLSRAVFIKGYCHTGNIVSSHTQDMFGT